MENQAALDKDLTVEELTEKEIKAVEKFHRQLSRDSILSIRTEDGLDEHDQTADEVDHDREVLPKETITQEEALAMQKVLRAFGYSGLESEILEEKADTVDGRKEKYRRLSSTESYYNYESSWRSSTSRFVSPGRFYVRVSEETKAIVREVHEKIKVLKPANSNTDCVRLVNQETLNSENWNNLHPNDIDFEMADVEFMKEPSRHPSNGVGPNYGIKNPEFGSQKSLISDQTISNATTGHDLSRLPPKQRFQELVRRALERKKEEEKRKKREFYTRLWKKRGNAGWLDLIFTILGLGAFFADSGTDLKVASDHFNTGHPWWGTFTLMLVIFPAILVNLVSYFFYKEDEDRGHGRAPDSGWKAVKITHICQLGLVERYWRILVKTYKMKFKKQLQDTHHYMLYIAMNLDVAMLQMILAFTEDAPQLVLQLYVLIRRHLVETLQTSKLQDLWTIASICFSFISYSRATVNYISCLRNSKKHKGVLRWYGYISMLFWRSFMFISRILVLVFFASEFPLWFFLVLFLHFVLILALMTSQEVNFFPEQKGMQYFFRVVIAYIHTFCFFPLDASKTIKWAIIYYILTATEAVIFSSLWFTNAYRDISLQLELAGLSVIFVSYTLGLLMMVVYYKFLHPKFKRPQTKWYTKAPPKEELCEEVEDEEEEEEEEENEEEEQERLEEGESETTQEQAEHLEHLARDRASVMARQFAVWV